MSQVKLWAESHNLNDPKCGTLNSWSLTQMVSCYLYICSPLMVYRQELHDSCDMSIMSVTDIAVV